MKKIRPFCLMLKARGKKREAKGTLGCKKSKNICCFVHSFHRTKKNL